MVSSALVAAILSAEFTLRAVSTVVAIVAISAIGWARVVAVVAGIFGFDSESLFVAYYGLENEGLLRRDGLPILNSSCIDWSCAFAYCEDNDGDGVVGVILLVLVNWRNSNSPDFVFHYGCTSNLPGDFLAFASNFIKDLLIGWARGNQNGICHEANIAGVNERGRLNVGKTDEASGICWVDEVAKVDEG